MYGIKGDKTDRIPKNKKKLQVWYNSLGVRLSNLRSENACRNLGNFASSEKHSTSSSWFSDECSLGA